MMQLRYGGGYMGLIHPETVCFGFEFFCFDDMSLHTRHTCTLKCIVSDMYM